MGKHAYLIMAHTQLGLLQKLLRVLDDERNDIYLHLDQKIGAVDEQKLRACVSASSLVLVERMSVTWAGESQIACEMRLFRAASLGHYQYYHLLSGLDFPVKTQDEIHSFFDRNDGWEFIEYWDRPPAEYLFRIRYRYPFQEKIGRYTYDPKTLFYRVLSKAGVFLQWVSGRDRLKGDSSEIKIGPNWVSLTDGLVQYLLGRESEIQSRFMQGVAADELFVQTLCWDSPFRGRISPRGNLRLIDWERGRPYTWQEGDFDEVFRSEALFIRKVSEDNRLPELIAQALEQKKAESGKGVSL